MRILLIEDEQSLCEILQDVLITNGFSVDICGDGIIGLEYVLQNAYDLIILDRMLPNLEGVSLLEIARKKGIKTPVLMLTAMGTEKNQIIGLDAGADDYLIKPVATPILLAHIRALLRRPATVISETNITYGDISVQLHERLLKGPSGECHLSIKEFEMLMHFIKNPTTVFSREMLLNKIWGVDCDVSDGNLTNYIFLVRRRLELVESKITVKTVHSLGYTMGKYNA